MFFAAYVIFLIIISVQAFEIFGTATCFSYFFFGLNMFDGLWVSDNNFCWTNIFFLLF